MLRKELVLAVILCTFWACNLQAAQINSTWVGGALGDWGVASNWNPATVPNNGGSQTFAVTINGPPSKAQVGIYSGYAVNSIATYGNVKIDRWEYGPVMELIIFNGLNNYGDLELLMKIRGNITNNTNATLSFWDKSLTIYDCNLYNANGATIEFGVEIDFSNGSVKNDGVYQASSSGGFSESNIFLNNGQVQLYDGGANGAVFDNNTTGTIKGFGHVTGGQLQNRGSIEAVWGQLVLYFDSITSTGLLKTNPGTDLFIHTSGSDVNNQGTIEINAGGSVVCDANLVNQPNSVIALKGGTLGAKNITQKAGAKLEGDGKISGNLILQTNAHAAFTGPTEIYGKLQIDANAVLDVNDGTTLITGQTTCNGTIHMKGGRIIPQGGLTGDCHIIWEPGTYTNIADFNLDGKVNFADFAYFADTWLWESGWR
jgi:hypothetical protein